MLGVEGARAGSHIFAVDVGKSDSLNMLPTNTRHIIR